MHGVVSAVPTALWEAVGASAGVTRDMFDHYFGGAATAHAIGISRPVRFEQSLGLAELRQRVPGFHPPQVYLHLSDDQVRRLMSENRTGQFRMTTRPCKV